jgi:hypothetical protein
MEFPVDKRQNRIYSPWPLWPYPPAIEAMKKNARGGHRQHRCAPEEHGFAHAHNNKIVRTKNSFKQ